MWQRLCNQLVSVLNGCFCFQKYINSSWHKPVKRFVQKPENRQQSAPRTVAVGWLFLLVCAALLAQQRMQLADKASDRYLCPRGSFSAPWTDVSTLLQLIASFWTELLCQRDGPIQNIRFAQKYGRCKHHSWHDPGPAEDWSSVLCHQIQSSTAPNRLPCTLSLDDLQL